MGDNLGASILTASAMLENCCLRAFSAMKYIFQMNRRTVPFLA